MNEQIIQTLLQEAAPRILGGISPQEAPAVSKEFEHLLTMCLVKTYRAPSPKNDEDALWAGRYLIEETCKVPPVDRLEHIRKELLDREIRDLDRRAQGLAERSPNASADLPAFE